MGDEIRQTAFAPLIEQLESNLAVAIELDYPGRGQILSAIAGQLRDASQALLDLSIKARLASMN